MGALNAGGGEVPGAPPGAAGLAVGSGGAARDYRGTVDWGTDLDVEVNGTTGAGDATGHDGRAGAARLRQTARLAAAAIAQATGSNAGVKMLVSTVDERMADMQHQIDTTKSQNKLLAGRLRQLAMAYRSGGPGGALGAARKTMGGGMGMGGMPSMGGVSVAALLACPPCRVYPPASPEPKGLKHQRLVEESRLGQGRASGGARRIRRRENSASSQSLAARVALIVAGVGGVVKTEFDMQNLASGAAALLLVG